jgi:uncharacterized protein DUF4157
MTGGRRGQGGFRGTSPAGSTVNDASTGRCPGKETLVQRLESQPIFARALDTPTGTTMPPGAEPNSPANAASPVSQADEAGQALPDDVLARMNKRFGHDFSHVRIHTGPSAARLAANLGAKALTQGGYIYFGCGSFATAES